MYDLYLAQYTHKYGNGYAIIGARNAEQVSSILRNQGRFKDAIIVACKKIELPTPPDGDMQLMIEGAVTTIGNSAYDIAVSLGFRGTKEEWLESMKGPKGDPGPAGSYIAGKGIDITDGVISVIESGSKISYTPNITEGTKLGTLNVDDNNYNIYSPVLVDAYTKDETDDLLSAKQDTISAGGGIDIANNVVSVDNTVAKKTDVYTKGETDSLLNNKQNTLTTGENINIENNVISVPRIVILKNIYSPSDNEVLNIYSNAEQTRDYIDLTAWGYDFDAQISMEGCGNDNEVSSIRINASGYSEANVELYGGGETRRSQVEIYASGYSEGSIVMRGGTENEKKSEIIITADGYDTEHSKIHLVSSDENNLSHINIDSQRFTYKDNDVAIKPIDSTFVSGNTIVLTDNYIYSGSSITSLTINGTNFTGDCLVQFTTGASTPSITISGLVFDVLPTFNSNKYYELGIHNGHCLWVEYNS